VRSFSFKRTKASSSKRGPFPAGSDSVQSEVFAHNFTLEVLSDAARAGGRCTPCSGWCAATSPVRMVPAGGARLPGQMMKTAWVTSSAKSGLAQLAQGGDRPSRDATPSRVYRGESVRDSPDSSHRLAASPGSCNRHRSAGLLQMSTMQTARGSFTRRLHGDAVILPRTKALFQNQLLKFAFSFPHRIPVPETRPTRRAGRSASWPDGRSLFRTAIAQRATIRRSCSRGYGVTLRHTVAP